jgi:beta-glucosidase
MKLHSMPGLGTSWGPRLNPLVANGTIKESRISDAAIRLLTPYYASSQANGKFPTVPFSAGYVSKFPTTPRDVRQPGTAALIRKIGRDSVTLLKNEREALPMGKGQYRRVAVVGEDAGDNALGPLGCGNTGECPIDNMVRFHLSSSHFCDTALI